MRADARANREILLATARSLFADRGPDVSLRSVADEAGVGIGTLYRHFPARSDLILGVGQDIASQVIDLAGRWSTVWDADPEAAWRGFVGELADLRLGVLLPRLATVLTGPPNAAEFLRLRGQVAGALEGILSRARGAGFVDDSISWMYFHVGLATVTRPIAPQVALEIPDVHDWLVEVYLRGLRPDA